jgi:hypothetical protein
MGIIHYIEESASYDVLFLEDKKRRFTDLNVNPTYQLKSN